MHELRARFFVRTGDELAERAVDGDEDAVAFVEFEPTDECAVGPACKTLLDVSNQCVERFRAAFTNGVQDVRL